MSGADLDTRVRTQAFQFLTEQTRFHGEVVPRDLLERRFDFEGRRVPLIGPQGIFKPAPTAWLPASRPHLRPGTPSAHPPWRRPEGIMRQLESEA